MLLIIINSTNNFAKAFAAVKYSISWLSRGIFEEIQWSINYFSVGNVICLYLLHSFHFKTGTVHMRAIDCVQVMVPFSTKLLSNKFLDRVLNVCRIVLNGLQILGFKMCFFCCVLFSIKTPRIFFISDHIILQLKLKF